MTASEYITNADDIPQYLKSRNAGLQDEINELVLEWERSCQARQD